MDIVFYLNEHIANDSHIETIHLMVSSFSSDLFQSYPLEVLIFLLFRIIIGKVKQTPHHVIPNLICLICKLISIWAIVFARISFFSSACIVSAMRFWYRRKVLCSQCVYSNNNASARTYHSRMIFDAQNKAHAAFESCVLFCFAKRWLNASLDRNLLAVY